MRNSVHVTGTRGDARRMSPETPQPRGAASAWLFHDEIITTPRELAEVPITGRYYASTLPGPIAADADTEPTMTVETFESIVPAEIIERAQGKADAELGELMYEDMIAAMRDGHEALLGLSDEDRAGVEALIPEPEPADGQVTLADIMEQLRGEFGDDLLDRLLRNARKVKAAQADAERAKVKRRAAGRRAKRSRKRNRGH